MKIAYSRTLWYSLFLNTTLVILAGCSDLQLPGGEATPAPTATVHWTYEGEEGPENWGELSGSFASCASGQEQSPIDVAQPAGQDLANPTFSYQTSPIKIEHNGHTVQLHYAKGSFMEINGERYELKQFHYHAPSEHSLNNELFPAEFHLVHQNTAGQYAVVGILLREGAENPAYQPFIAHLPAEKSAATTVDGQINALELLPTTHTTFRYPGSLTTPPCTEGVSWFLMTTPIELSLDQLTALESLFEEGNNRPVQPIFNRAVSEDTTP